MKPESKHDEHGEYQLITITEWKRLYGTPGDGGKPDINGRINGYFPTEPDYCEDEVAA